MGKLDARVALVTGGLRGIGRAIVDRFLEEGALVVVGDLDADGGGVEEAHPGRLLYRRLDVISAADWTAAWAAAEARFGPVSILINNAGASRAGSIADTSDDDWHAVMNLNAFGTFLGCRHAVRTMSGGGTIVNIASARGRRPGSTQCAYSASKAAVLSLTESTALHCGEHALSIRCNAICPGVVETPLIRRHLAELDDPAARDAVTAKQLLGRMGAPSEIADAALFLASDDASFVTGATLDVDGGFRIRDL